MARIFLFFSLTYSLIFLWCTTAQLVNPEIDKACALAQFKGRCIKTLMDAPGSKAAGVKEFTFIIVNESKAYGVKIKGLVEERLKNTTTTPVVKKALQNCKEEYSDAMEQIEKSAKGLKTPSPETFSQAQTFLSTVLTNVDSCQQGLALDKNVLEEAGGNRVFKELISTSLAVVNAARNRKNN